MKTELVGPSNPGCLGSNSETVSWSGFDIQWSDVDMTAIADMASNVEPGDLASLASSAKRVLFAGEVDLNFVAAIARLGVFAAVWEPEEEVLARCPDHPAATARDVRC